MAYRRTTDFEEADYMSAPSRSRGGGNDVRVMERDREHDVYIDQHRDRTPSFLRENIRRPEPGPMVLRRREVESFDRHRSRSPTPPPARVVEERIVRRARSESPPHAREHSRTRIVETERTVSPQRRSPSPVVRFVEHRRRERERSPSEDLEHDHIRIIERERERGRSPERSPSPPPVVRAPTIEREVITHYTDVDHGVIRARQPSPPPRIRQQEDYRETDIDIHLDKHHTDVDIRKRAGSRSRSRSRHHHHDDELVIYEDAGRPRRSRSMHQDAGYRSKYGGALVPILKNGRGKSAERRTSVAVVDHDTEIDIERSRRRRSRSRPKVVAPRETWTEVSRDLVSREAIERLGYPYEEAKYYYYIMMFLPSDAVSELMDLTEDIRRSRRRRAHRRADELEVDIEIDHDHYHAHRPQRPVPRRRRRSSGYLDERFRELEVSVDERRPRGGYYYY